MNTLPSLQENLSPLYRKQTVSTFGIKPLSNQSFPPSSIHFGGGGFSNLPQVNPIKFRTVADKLAKIFDAQWTKSRITREVDFLNMSLPDWMNRLMLIFCLYVPQAYTSIKKDQHKWETSGRNVITWFMSIGIFMLMKYDRFSINTLLDNFMRPQGTPYELLNDKLVRAQRHLEHLKKTALKEKPTEGAEWPFWKRVENRLGIGKNPIRFTIEQRQANKNYRRNLKLAKRLETLIPQLNKKRSGMIEKFGTAEKAGQFQGGTFHKAVNRLRLPVNYYDLLNKPGVGIKIKPENHYRAFWATLDALDMELIFKRITHLKEQQKHSLQGLSKAETVELKSLQQFMRRLSNFKFISFAGATALSVTLGGYLLMWSVFRLIAPLDHDFDPDRMPAKLKQQIREHNKKSHEKVINEKVIQEAEQSSEKPIRLQNGGLLA